MPKQFQVAKESLERTRFVEVDDRPLEAGEVRLKVDTFAFTSNNMTYAVAGFSLGYWSFFPAADDPDNIWGIIPVWSLADVVESKCGDIPVGDRLYGYFPTSDSVIMKPESVTNGTMIDGTAHRQKLPPLYNLYTRVKAEPGYSEANDQTRTLLGPLHTTSYSLWDYMKQKDWFGAEQVAIVSASSKTGLGLAFAISRDDAAPHLVGLTSPQNADFVSETKLYNETVTYEAIADTLSRKATVVVDMAGNASVRANLQAYLGDKLSYYIGVGATHWGELKQSSQAKPDPSKQESFFVPSYIIARMEEVGRAEFNQRTADFNAEAAKATAAWMDVQTHAGLDALGEVYEHFHDGSISPSIGHVFSL